MESFENFSKVDTEPFRCLSEWSTKPRHQARSRASTSRQGHCAQCKRFLLGFRSRICKNKLRWTRLHQQKSKHKRSNFENGHWHGKKGCCTAKNGCLEFPKEKKRQTTTKNNSRTRISNKQLKIPEKDRKSSANC